MSFYYAFCSFPVSDVFLCFPCLASACNLNPLKVMNYGINILLAKRKKSVWPFCQPWGTANNPKRIYLQLHIYTFLWFRIYILME